VFASRRQTVFDLDSIEIHALRECAIRVGMEERLDVPTLGIDPYLLGFFGWTGRQDGKCDEECSEDEKRFLHDCLLDS
jgi:hypothetical protein